MSSSIPITGDALKNGGGRVKKQIPVKIDADIVKWFDKEAKHDINTILKGHVRLVEAQRKAANTPDQFFRPMLKPDKKKGKGKIKK